MKQLIKFILVLLLFASCKGEDSVEKEVEEVFEYRQPDHFPEPTYRYQYNPVSKEVFKLGRLLFYDGILSRDFTIACGSCHIQSSAFTHHAHKVSHGIEDKLGLRNAPSLANMAWQKDFFWIGGVNDLDFFHMNPIEDEVEMGDKLSLVFEKLKNHDEYPTLFKEAFGDTSEINYATMAMALSQFVLLMVSDNSKYDQYKRGETQLTADELKGLSLFQKKCATCHEGALFTDMSFRNNGIKIDPEYNDKGRSIVTRKSEDDYTFKVPSLRNVARTFPYMHDGRFFSLKEVLDHYDSGVQDTPNLDPLLKNGIPLTNKEKNQIIAFLHTLTDEDFLRDPRFAETGTDIIR